MTLTFNQSRDITVIITIYNSVKGKSKGGYKDREAEEKTAEGQNINHFWN